LKRISGARRGKRENAVGSVVESILSTRIADVLRFGWDFAGRIWLYRRKAKYIFRTRLVSNKQGDTWGRPGAAVARWCFQGLLNEAEDLSSHACMKANTKEEIFQLIM